MLNVHKPRVYRSVQGCCICRAKSSSSRFTDSKRYEQYFQACFHIFEPRSSTEICNACVLLTKRFQKLPPESTKDWRHVVDVREANSSRTAARGAYNSDLKSKKSDKFSSKHRFRSSFSGRESSSRESSPVLPLGSSASPVPPFCSPDAPFLGGDGGGGGGAAEAQVVFERSETVIPCCTSGACNMGSSQVASSSSSLPRNDVAGFSNNGVDNVRYNVGSGADEVVSNGVERDVSDGAAEEFSAFIDPLVWRKIRVCCGLLFVGPRGAVILDQSHWRPCQRHRSSSAKRDN